jgi:hypothetical protein
MDANPVRTNIEASDMDAQENVVLWDHGPQPPEHPSEQPQFEADLKDWLHKHFGLPVPVRLHVADAKHALMNDQRRYALEPRDSDGDVKAEIQKIRHQREEQAKTTTAQADAIQLAADRKAAVATVMAARKAAAVAHKAAGGKPDHGPHAADPKTAAEHQRIRDAATAKHKADLEAEHEAQAKRQHDALANKPHK